MTEYKSGREAREAREKIIILQHKFENRITIAKHGKAALNAGEYATALHKLTDYLEIMAEVHKVSDFYSLKPTHFDPKKDLTEMLMISHVFFELARVYDAIPKYQAESKKCLNQFIAFSVNQPYQVVNSELIRKHIKKMVVKQPLIFQACYEQIYVQSKKCYIVTFCYGTDHQMTQDYRRFKDYLLETRTGLELVRIYYKHSSILVDKYHSRKSMQLFAKYFFKPVLVLFSKTILKFILPRC